MIGQLIQDGVSNTLAFGEKAFDKVTDLTNPLNLINNPLLPTIGRPIADVFRPGLIDLIKLPERPAFPGPSGESSYQGMIDSINGLSGEIDSLKKKLENPDLTPEERMQLSFELQEKMQERMQMITMLTNLMKTEHDGVTAIANNFRV